MGKEVGSLTGEDKKKIGIMMDQFGVYERLSCADNLKLFADIYGIDHKKVKDILDQVGLSEAYNRPAMNFGSAVYPVPYYHAVADYYFDRQSH